jgi:hypothetical protein
MISIGYIMILGAKYQVDAPAVPQGESAQRLELKLSRLLDQFPLDGVREAARPPGMP